MDQRAYLYLRKSRALNDPDDPELLAAHRARLLRLVEADGRTVDPARIIEEVGSGESLSERPRFRALIEQFEAGKAAGGILYCVAVDRLSRGSLAEVGRIMEALSHAGVTVRTPERIYDLSQPDDELFYAFVAALSRHELGRYRQRVQLKWREMTLAGLIVSGGGRFGYRWDKNLRSLVAVEAELAIVRGLFADALALSTYRLGEKYGISAGHVWTILRNPVYTGWPARHMQMVRWRGGAGKKGGRRLPAEEWLWPLQPGTYPAACTREQFLRVQEALAQRERERTKTGSTNGWCRDLVEFEERPGARIELGSHHTAAGRYLTYTTRPGEGRRLYVDRDLIHAAAWAALERVFARPELLAQALQKRAQQAKEPPKRDVPALHAGLAQARRRHDELLRREIDSPDAEERASISRLRAEARAQIAALSRELSALPSPGPILPSALLEAIPRMGAAFPSAWDQLEEPGRRALARSLLGAVVVRITPRRKPNAWTREVTETRYAEWLASFMKGAQ